MVMRRERRRVNGWSLLLSILPRALLSRPTGACLLLSDELGDFDASISSSVFEKRYASAYGFSDGCNIRLHHVSRDVVFGNEIEVFERGCDLRLRCARHVPHQATINPPRSP